MNDPTISTIKRLFALSGNRCAYENCTLPIVESSGAVTGIICHIKARNKGGPRFDAKQTAEDRHSFGNLVLMCARHGKLIDCDPRTYTVELLKSIKAAHENRNGSIELSQLDAAKAEALFRDYRSLYIKTRGHVMVNSPGGIQGTHVTVKTTKSKVKVMPAEGTLGSNALCRNYVKHLIDRYNEFASKQPQRTKFSFAAIYSHIKKQFGADWERTLLSQFDGLVSMLQQRINNTRLGGINQGKGFPNYSSFAEYRSKYVGGSGV